MKIAKATDEDINIALEIASALDAISNRWCPSIAAMERERDEAREYAEKRAQEAHDVELALIARAETAEQARDEWIACHAVIGRKLTDLLCRIHGWQKYRAEGSLDDAIAYAEQRIYDDRGALDAMTAERDALAEELSAFRASSDIRGANCELMIQALREAEAALADIGDADREPGDDVAWCEARAAKALPSVRAALAQSGGERSVHPSIDPLAKVGAP